MKVSNSNSRPRQLPFTELRYTLLFLYSLQLRSRVDNIPFTEDQPGYEEGRQMIQEQLRPPADIMQNNPPIQFQPPPSQQAEPTNYFSSAFGFLKKSTFTFIDKSSEIVSTVGQSVQTKLDETGASTRIAQAMTSMAETTKSVGSVIYEKGSTLVESGSAKIGEVKENPVVSDITQKSKEVIGNVGTTVSSVGSVSIDQNSCIQSLFSKLKTLVLENNTLEDGQNNS